MGGEGFDRVKREVPFSALNPSEIAGRHVQLLGETLLRQAATKAFGAHVRTERQPENPCRSIIHSIHRQSRYLAVPGTDHFHWNRSLPVHWEG